MAPCYNLHFPLDEVQTHVDKVVFKKLIPSRKAALMLHSNQLRHAELVLLGVFGLLAVSGCGRGKTIVKVSGKITVGGEPLTKAIVFFAPDKDNTLETIPRGTVDESGVYHLETDGAEGAPLGWYKVYVTFMSGKGVQGNPSPLKDVVNPKYLSALTTPISLEVVPNAEPDRYDIKMTKR
jgi:hypothetical protein